LATVFQKVVTEAINDLAAHGYDSKARLDRWVQRVEAAARAALIPEAILQRMLQDALGRVYGRLVRKDGLLPRHKGIDRYVLASIKPKLHAELDRRVLASSQLIKLNREASIARTLQRLSGWATSVPVGGSEATDRVKAKENVRRGIAALPFEERRVIIDQGHKLSASINEIVATDAGAIAAVWKHVREANYDARPAHEARDGEVFVVPGNWALGKGLMKLAGHEFTNDIEAPGEFVYCRCHYQYLYHLRNLPSQMLTAKGREAMEAARTRMGDFHVRHAHV
jgi:hypothetical protein